MSLNYAALVRYAGPDLEDSLPAPVKIGSGETVPDYSVAIYVAVGLNGEILYVGSVCRPGNSAGVASRLDEHLRKVDRLQTWDRVYLVPLKADTPLQTVRRVEGRIGAHLAPVTNKALPRIGNREYKRR